MTGGPDFIPWSAIHPRYKWAARDGDGRMFVYMMKPELSNDRFSKRHSHQRIDTVTTASPGNSHWAGSLQSRHDLETATSAEDIKAYINDAFDRLLDQIREIKSGSESIQDEERGNVMVRGGKLGGHASSFVDRVYGLGVDSGITVEQMPDGGSRVVVRAGSVPEYIPINNLI